MTKRHREIVVVVYFGLGNHPYFSRWDHQGGLRLEMQKPAEDC